MSQSANGEEIGIVNSGIKAELVGFLEDAGAAMSCAQILLCGYAETAPSGMVVGNRRLRVTVSELPAGRPLVINGCYVADSLSAIIQIVQKNAAIKNAHKHTNIQKAILSRLVGAIERFNPTNTVASGSKLSSIVTSTYQIYYPHFLPHERIDHH